MIFILASLITSAQDTLQYKLDDIVVTSSSVSPISFSNISRSVQIITSDEIERLPATSLNELLQYSASLDIRQRGVDGIQSDIGIRGGTFEQTLILINGIQVIDPQTGHHNLNLPFRTADVARIEILKGPGGKIFGANSFSGVVNIITKEISKNSFAATVVGGQHSYFQQGINGSIMLSNFSNRISFNRSKSDGYIHNTNYEDLGFSIQSSMKFPSGNLELLYGYNNKKFGANSFYSNNFPNQWEHTSTNLLNLSTNIANSFISFSSKFHWRKNHDRFLLDFTNPAFYENIHTTDVYGIELSSSFKTVLGITSIGTEFNIDLIKSSNLGDHRRERKGFFIEQQTTLWENINLNVGSFLYKYGNSDWKLWPGIDLSLRLNNRFRIYGTYGQGFRIPTFTELYYNSPANIGNINLASEEVSSYELGVYFQDRNLLLNCSIFKKDGTNIIDWFKFSENNPWQVRNIADITTLGFEVVLDYVINDFFINSLSIGYTYLNIDKTTSSVDSRYFLEHLRHQITLKVFNTLPFGVSQSWCARFEDRLQYLTNFIADTKISKNLNQFTLFLSATNLFNNSYVDFTSIKMPGRWIKFGLEYNINID